MLGIGALELDRLPVTDRGGGKPAGSAGGGAGSAVGPARAVTRATPDEAGALFEAYGERIRRYIAFRVRSDADAEDLASEVFRRLMSGPVPVEPEARPAWLFRVAHNAIVDHYRRRRFIVPLASLLDRPDDAPGLPEVAVRDERLAAVDAALRGLVGRQRAAIYLRYYEDLEYADIATIMGVPAVTVRTLVHRGLKKVAAHLAEADR
jgi:RNA polymerase sigma-70 factor (ECF subfamily)